MYKRQDLIDGQEINLARLLFAFKHGYTAPFAWWMGFVFHIFPGKRGKLRLQAQCITQIKTLPEVSFGRVLQNSIDISLFQRAFRNFSAVSGVGCRSLRNLFAQDQGAGVAARKVQSAGLFVLAAQLFDGTCLLYTSRCV